MSEYYEIPVSPYAVYALLDANSVVVYVGYSKAVPSRSYAGVIRFPEVTLLRIYPCNSRYEARSLETKLIAKFRPIHNLNGWKGKSNTGRDKLFNPEDEEAIKDAWRAGLTEAEIADALGCSQMTISRVVTGRYRNIK